jgi:hypothetical protein
MFRRNIQTIVLIAAALALATVVQAQAPGAGRGAAPPPAPQKIMQVKQNLYIVTGAGGNSTVRD